MDRFTVFEVRRILIITLYLGLGGAIGPLGRNDTTNTLNGVEYSRVECDQALRNHFGRHSMVCADGLFKDRFP